MNGVFVFLSFGTAPSGYLEGLYDGAMRIMRILYAGAARRRVRGRPGRGGIH